MKSGFQKTIAAIIFLLVTISYSKSQTNKPADESFTIENYYKVKLPLCLKMPGLLLMQISLLLIKKQLYPDLDKLTKDEQHRFELLLAHWDVMVEKIDLQ